MTFDILVQLILDSGIAQAHRLLRGVEILEICLDVLLVFQFELLRQFVIDIDHFFLVDGLLLLVQVVHDEEVLSFALVEVNTIDVIEVRHGAIDDIPVVVTALKYVLTWIDEYLELISNSDFQSYQEYAPLLVKNHGHVFEFQVFVFVFLKRDPV